MDFPVEILTGDQLMRQPEPPWLIDSLIHEQEIGAFWGPPSSAKSFVALDWALSIAAGVPWQGFETKQGPVLYLAGEGGYSLARRISAWQAEHPFVPCMPPVYFVIRPLPLREYEALEAIQTALTQYQGRDDFAPQDINPSLIVVDTLSQFFGSGDEVGPEMRDFVENIRELSRMHSSAVLVIHHSNAKGERERGHSALRGNVDVMYALTGKKTDGILSSVVMVNDKQRDAQEAQIPELTIRRVRQSLALMPLVTTQNAPLEQIMQESFTSMRQRAQVLADRTGTSIETCRSQIKRWVREHPEG
jgi:hypothetical protein